MTQQLFTEKSEQLDKQLAFLVEAVGSLLEEVAAIRKRLDELESDEELFDPVESFRVSWQQAQRGETIPLERLWDGIDAE